MKKIIGITLAAIMAFTLVFGMVTFAYESNIDEKVASLKKCHPIYDPVDDFHYCHGSADNCFCDIQPKAEATR